MESKHNIIFAILFFLTTNIFATPKHIIIIGHGEHKNSAKDVNLTTRGYQRAHALVPLFANMPLTHEGTLSKKVKSIDGIYTLPALYGQPVALYAQAQNSNNSSIKPIMTITPLAKQLNLGINRRTIQDTYAPLIEEITNKQSYDNQMVLMCWDYKAIPTIAQEFLTQYANGVKLPKHLKAQKTFNQCDRILRITFKKEKITNLDNLSQKLLYNDSPTSTNACYTISHNKITRTK